MNLDPREKLIVALDFARAEQALTFVEEMGDAVLFYKIGLELFSASGPAIVKDIKSLGKKVFLDLKFHDIPATVAAASARAVEIGADMFNVHSLGGVAMMRAAAASALEASEALGTEPPVVLAVTVLTSLDIRTLQEEIGISTDNLREFVVEKARQAREAGLGGVVASAQEAADIRSACGSELEVVTPGIRPAWAPTDDQRRITTPSEAVALGASRIVVGRPITRADDPFEAIEKIVAELAEKA
ncbi:MAG: orotidine-5'-phosphate decarboxylase [Candidatus Abyssobacteria bacterium SURF_5]|uniref:Orotidine 5'-phosphate decarboxylase n=1 Tax=Abyssobacteria bacterium (strain SURF_5) TaxID=2093360 RepID=A0A3A4NFD4_ABYX5|nr:MAG: orotidine-5'-phosphate decarboxylase [Candidatus Abyssubacteria bacterium SURF_5]